jgi:energy-coupling factor transport system permease protein
MLQRTKDAITILSILVTWSLENAIETADSMKSRGYGLPGRTAFSIYRFDRRDKLALLWLLFCGGYIILGWALGGLRWWYYPIISGALMGAFPVSLQLAYLALCLTPVIMNRMEVRKWKRLTCEA